MPYLLHQLLSKNAKKYPDNTALVCNGTATSYFDLNIASNKLANSLLAEGIQKGDRVGFHLNKSAESIICIFGILKAGGVYVPLDPLAPPKRIAYIIQNCRIRCLITTTDQLTSTWQHFSQNQHPDNVIVIDNAAPPPSAKTHETEIINWHDIIENGNTSEPDSGDIIDQDLAYILYTSGSTGNPKGVMITHANSLQFVNWTHKQFQTLPSDRTLSLAPLHFDLSIFDIFTTIKSGATLYLPPGHITLFPKMLIEFIQVNEISVIYCVPSVPIYLMVHGNLRRHSFHHLRLILFAGEVFPVKYLKELMGIVPNAEYFNLYGPTETNVCTFYQVTMIEDNRIKPVPIGKACPNIEIFALNKNGAVISKPWEEGELCVRGSTVALGYWGDQEKSRKLFVDNFISPQFPDKIYLTGDIVTIDENGDYHLIGRKDHMVKSRGYRIELGEIESVLFAHPEVKDVCVTALPDEHIGNKLQAFIVTDGAQPVIDIKAFCAEHLPKYMIPEEIEFCKALPKTSTGKTDRKLLEASSKKPA